MWGEGQALILEAEEGILICVKDSDSYREVCSGLPRGDLIPSSSSDTEGRAGGT